MRKNRKRRANTKVVPRSLVGLIILGATLALLYCGLESKCDQLGQDIRKHEQRFDQLEAERVREATRWSDCKTPEKLNQALLRHGLEMGYPAADQMVRMESASGQPAPGQIALAKFNKERATAGQVVHKRQ